MFLKFIHDTNSIQTQQFYYIITFKATFFNCIESSSGLLKKRSNVSTVIVHSGIQKAYNMGYSQYKSTCITDLTIHTVQSVEIPTRCSFVIEFIIPKFFKGSTCFERHTTHHQELQTVFAASGLYAHMVTGRCQG